MRHKKKATVTLYIMWFIVAIMIITIAAVLSPMGVLFNTKMFQAGESILADAQDEISGIQNATIRDSLNNVMTTAMNAGEDNIEFGAQVFQYAWVIMLILSAIIVFLTARRLVEVNAGGGGFI